MPLRPSFQASTTRIEYRSMASGFGRNDQNRHLSASACLKGPEIAVQAAFLCFGESPGEVGHPRLEHGNRNLGPSPKGQRQCEEQANQEPGKPGPGIYLPPGWAPKSTPGSGGDRLFVLDGKTRLGLIAKRPWPSGWGERADRRVVLLDRLDIAIAGHRDAVFRPLPVAPAGRGKAPSALRLDSSRNHQQPWSAGSSSAPGPAETPKAGGSLSSSGLALGRRPGRGPRSPGQHILFMGGMPLTTLTRLGTKSARRWY